MKSRLPALVFLALALAAIFGGASSARAGSVSIRPVCGAVPLGYARCFSLVKGNATAAAPSGYGPADLQSAYKLPSATAGSGQTVAIVDAFDDPTAESDLAQYRSFYGLPPCTTANGCFRKVNETGGTIYPAPSPDWALEISLDLDMVSAVCPNCHILLVEATTNLDSDLYTAEDTAAALGANAISNSWGGSEYSGQTSDDAHFNHSGVAITASSGDSGYGVSYPAASRFLTAVGGTSLTRNSSSRGWTESAWSGAGSGCSAYDAKPSWQTDTGCARRTVSDVSAVADPNTGVAVLYGGLWWTVGGTSASSPIVASVYALAGNASSVTYGSYPYSHTTGLFDVVSGSNGSCSPSYLCHGQTGYDGPTGLGTPNGVSGF
ncbi:MAG: peptidase S8 [Actinobacteria bacterium]|nr:MAG: peptidase S8 [Actinomycetota bacterium]